MASRRITKDEDGFSLLELLAAVLIIGILAAIAIPSLLSQRDKAGDASAKSYARSLRTAEESHYTDNSAYTGDFAVLKTVEPTLATLPDGATDPTVTVSGRPANAFTVAVRANSGVTYTLRRASDGRVTRTCDRSSKGGCNASGSW